MNLDRAGAFGRKFVTEPHEGFQEQMSAHTGSGTHHGTVPFLMAISPRKPMK